MYVYMRTCVYACMSIYKTCVCMCIYGCENEYTCTCTPCTSLYIVHVPSVWIYMYMYMYMYIVHVHVYTSCTCMYRMSIKCKVCASGGTEEGKGRAIWCSGQRCTQADKYQWRCV